jgi:prepilin-type N-terminal cleavage/methylation domain-containing protein
MSEATTRSAARGRSREAGFTLIEVLVSIVVLAFGLIAVTNLLVVAGSSNAVANATTATTAAAHQQLDILKSTPFTALVDGGSLIADAAGYFSDPDLQLPGTGTIHTRWTVGTVGGDAQLRYIEVQSEATGALIRSRSRVRFSTFRACTATTLGCPAP